MEASVVARQASAAGAEVLMLPGRTGAQSHHARQRLKCPLPVSGAHSHAGAVVAAVPRQRRRPTAIRAAIQSEVAGEAARKTSTRKESRRRLTADRPQLFVGLPLDAVSESNSVNHTKAIAAGLKALKLLGVDGVELPIWWGVVEKEAMGQYDWSGYLALAQTIRDAGLQIRASLNFHASSAPAIPLPQWVSRIGEADPDIFFTDRTGKRQKDYLSLSVDELPVLEGKTPVEVYSAFLHSFRTTFSDFLGSSITDVVIGLGPDGELKYPAQQPAPKNKAGSGVGEFQCYDKNMLADLKLHAEAAGNHFWGLAGPHDAPRYNESPESTNFFKEHGGSWDTPYGDFFLSWYSSRLISHGDRLLSLATAAFSDVPVAVAGKIPVMHAWSKHRAHPAELAAGFHNTDKTDGYDAVAEMFARNSAGMIVPAMDLSDEGQPPAARSSPETLVVQILRACEEHGVAVTGENSSLRGKPEAAFGKIKETLSKGTGSPLVGQFTYQRMGAYFFSPEHFPAFTQFVRSLDWSELHPDDLPADNGETIPLTPSSAAESSRQMQAV